MELKGTDRGVLLKTHRGGFYTIQARLLVDDVVFTGKLSEKFLAREKIEPRVERPPSASGAGPSSVDPKVLEQVQKYAAGGTGPEGLIQVISDAGRADADRDAAAKALAGGPKKAVRAVIDLLYNPDAEARAHGIGIVKALLGKDYGYKPGGGEEGRRTAIQKLNKDLADHPEWLEG
jgi:hypothetical protein